MESNTQPCRTEFSRSSQEKLNLSQLPLLLSSPSKTYACVEILNCPNVVLTLVNVPCCCPRCHPPPSDAWRGRQTPAGDSQISGVSVKTGSLVGPPPSSKTTRRFARSFCQKQQIFNEGSTQDQRFPVSMRVGAPATSCFPRV